MGEGTFYFRLLISIFLSFRFDEAEQYYRRSIETNPKEESAYLKLYSLAQEQGQLDDILKSLLDLGQFCILFLPSQIASAYSLT